MKGLIVSLFAVLSLTQIKAQEIQDFEIDPIRTSFYTNYFQKGVILYAFGDNPIWILEMLKDKKIMIGLVDGTISEANIYSQEEDSTMNSTTYFAKMKSGYVQFTVNKTDCTDNYNWTKKHFPYFAEVHYHDIDQEIYYHFKGCAEWIPDFRLHDIWMLYKINDSIIDKTKYAHVLPRMEIHIDKMSMLGNDGCNEVRSLIQIDKETISFNKIEMMTQKICETFPFMKSLENKTFQFSVQNGILELKDGDKKYLFKRTD